MKEVIKTFKKILNGNKYVAGIAMILFTIGSKYLKFDLDKNTKRILNNTVFKKLTIISIFYIGSRDILASIILTVIFIILTEGLLNENSKYCLLTKSSNDDRYYKKEESKEIIKGT